MSKKAKSRKRLEPTPDARPLVAIPADGFSMSLATTQRASAHQRSSRSCPPQVQPQVAAQFTTCLAASSRNASLNAPTTATTHLRPATARSMPTLELTRLGLERSEEHTSELQSRQY